MYVIFVSCDDGGKEEGLGGMDQSEGEEGREGEAGCAGRRYRDTGEEVLACRWDAHGPGVNW